MVRRRIWVVEVEVVWRFDKQLEARQVNHELIHRCLRIRCSAVIVEKAYNNKSKAGDGLEVWWVGEEEEEEEDGWE